MSEADELRARLTRFPTRRPRRRLDTGPAPAAPAGLPPPGDVPAGAGGFSEGGAPYETGRAEPSLLTMAAEAKRRRRRRGSRVGMALSVLCWLIVVLVPLAALVVELSLTATCALPSGLADGRMRLTWHQIWLISGVVTVIPVCYLAWHAPGRLMAVSVLGSYGLWKGVAIARDRFALPVCPDRWPPGAPRDPLDVPLTLATGGAFALFVFLAGLAALLRRRSRLLDDY